MHNQWEYVVLCCTQLCKLGKVPLRGAIFFERDQRSTVVMPDIIKTSMPEHVKSV